MSSLFSIANPGGGNLKPYGSKEDVNRLFTGVPDELPGGQRKSAISKFMDGNASIKRVKVEVFDLSDALQRAEYEKLWANLLTMMSNGSVVVDSHSDLVKHPDGTSYWMKYIEYVEFDGANPSVSGKEG